MLLQAFAIYSTAGGFLVLGSMRKLQGSKKCTKTGKYGVMTAETPAVLQAYTIDKYPCRFTDSADSIDAKKTVVLTIFDPHM